MHARCKTRKKEKKGNQIAYYFPLPPVKKEIFENQILFYLPPQLTLLPPPRNWSPGD